MVCPPEMAANRSALGVIGEMGVSRPITPTEERALAAAARAQRPTGVAINVHFDIGGESAEYNHAIDILERAKAPISTASYWITSSAGRMRWRCAGNWSAAAATSSSICTVRKNGPRFTT